MIDAILEHNREFVENEGYREYTATKYPRFKTAVISCMDARLVHLLPAALGLEDGDVVLIKNAGGRMTDPYGETMRSMMVAIYELGVVDIMIVGHTDCGAQKISAKSMIGHMTDRGIPRETIEKLEEEADLDNWLAGFDSNEDDVHATYRALREHPLLPSDVRIHGFVIDIVTGELTRVVRSQHLEVAGHPVELRAGGRPYPYAGGRSGIHLRASRVAYQADVQPAAPGLGHVADHLVLVRHLQDDLLLTGVHPGIEGLPVLLLGPEGAFDGRVTDLGGHLALAHVQVRPDEDDHLVLLRGGENAERHGCSIAVRYLRIAPAQHVRTP